MVRVHLKPCELILAIFTIQARFNIPHSILNMLLPLLFSLNKLHELFFNLLFCPLNILLLRFNIFLHLHLLLYFADVHCINLILYEPIKDLLDPFLFPSCTLILKFIDFFSSKGSPLLNLCSKVSDCPSSP
jgi:hypothetical protein